MWNRYSIWTGLLVSMAWAVPGSAQVDPQRAGRYFNEAAVLCERDGGRLWGISLCGPMVIGDWRTDTIAMNQLPPTDVERPRGIGFANAPIDWGGTRWAAYVWDFITPLEDYPRARGELMLHELFHRIQPELGLVTLNGENPHLDTVDGRVWLRLEWRALAEALSLSGDDRLRAVQDALAFRSERRALFSDAEENERVEEIREGLAQYTGTVVTATSEAEAVASALDQLEAAENQESFVQTFSYTSGVAYGLLLDMLINGWRAEVRSTSDFGTLLLAGLDIEPTADVTEASFRYDGPELRRVEQARYEERQATVRELRNRFAIT
jgi:hypothetical protein